MLELEGFEASGGPNEDHLSAIVFNAFGLIFNQEHRKLKALQEEKCQKIKEAEASSVSASRGVRLGPLSSSASIDVSTRA